MPTDITNSSLILFEFDKVFHVKIQRQIIITAKIWWQTSNISAVMELLPKYLVCINETIRWLSRIAYEIFDVTLANLNNVINNNCDNLVKINKKGIYS